MNGVRRVRFGDHAYNLLRFHVPESGFLPHGSEILDDASTAILALGLPKRDAHGGDGRQSGLPIGADLNVSTFLELVAIGQFPDVPGLIDSEHRSEEHTSELQ